MLLTILQLETFVEMEIPVFGLTPGGFDAVFFAVKDSGQKLFFFAIIFRSS